MSESLFEKQQNPVPGPLDANFHVLILAAGDSALNPQDLIDCSQELPFSDLLRNHGFYTDIPPKLTGSPEEIEHTIEVAVRRSFDFMKCPLIFGGSAEILPAVLRGIRDQAGEFEPVSIENSAEYSGNPIVILADGDSLKSGVQNVSIPLESVKAVVVTGSSKADPLRIMKEISLLCERIQA